MARAKDNSDVPAVASAIATGGSGTFFEQHVDASFLALLLVRAIPPVLTDCLLDEVWFQTEHLGWKTDDVLLVGHTADGTKRRYAGQVKRSFRVSQTDDDCVKAFTDFWTDFNNTSLFVAGSDQLGLLLLSGGDTAAPSLRALCDCARASKNAADFSHRLQTDGLLNAKVRKNAEIIEAIAKEVPGVAFDADRFWRFLKALHIQSLDLNTSTSHTESLSKSLLALASNGHDKAGEAQLTWGELLAIVGGGMPLGKAITRENLPVAMQNRHQAIPAAAVDALKKAQEHSRTTLKRTRTAVGGVVSLNRHDAIATLLQDIAESPLVLVTGPAGSGKSALAKLAISHLADSAIVLAFSAEEFAVSHLDQALLQAQIPANAETLNALLAGQGRKILLIESVERLLEATSRNAFQDLLALCAGDSSWQIILTCRDYSVDIVRSSLLDPFGVVTKILRTPPLTDAEIDAVVTAIPSLSRPATHPFLRELFRTPYILDKAARMPWPEGGTLPNDERAFRRKFWVDIVRREDRAEDALPRRRQEAFIELCVRRAKALEPFAACGDLDATILQQLRNDNLIDFSPATEALGAPAHDVLEDWAVVEWIAERFAILGSRRKEFAEELGTYPAIRRAYRKWLEELLREDSAGADAFILGVVGDSDLPAHFKDDTLIAVLKSTSGGDFVTRSRSLLSAQNGTLLRRVIHLVRVACKTTPPWAKTLQPMWFLPEGPAWAAVLKVVQEEIGLFLPRDVGLIAGLLTDWASGIAWWLPTPVGATDAAKIAFKLLPHVDVYDRKEQLKTILEAILKIPNGDPVEFSLLVKRAVAHDGSDRIADEFTDLILSGMHGTFACRDAPDAVIRIAEATIIRPKNEARDDFHFSVEVDSSFGIREHLKQDFFPASAIQGPFSALLRNHAGKAVVFINRLLNHASDAYADPATRSQLEPPWQVELKLPEGTVKTYWCNPRLWNLYRGFSVGPYVLQCALMALEAFLLEFGKNDSFDLEEWLTYLLRETNNVAVVAVVASVSMAYPARAGRAAVSLLTSKDLICIDFARCVHEMHSPLSFPFRTALERILDNERKVSHKLPHRRHSLETLALQLQMSDLRPELAAILDAYKAALPPLEEQDEEDKLWRFALHRMDIRGFQAQKPPPLPPPKEAASDSDPPPDNRILFVPGPLEPDLQEVVDEAVPGQVRFNSITSLFLWGHKAFRNEPGSGADWRENLTLAKVPPTADDVRWPGDTWAFESSIFVAAVCVREHWTELNQEDRKWCTGKLLAAVLKDADARDSAIGMSGSVFDSAAAAASVLPLIFGSTLDVPTGEKILKALVTACTHPDEKVVYSAARGIGLHFGKTHPHFVRGFVGMFARRAKRLAELNAIDEKRPYMERRQHDDIQQEVRDEMRLIQHWTIPCTQAEMAAVPSKGWLASQAYKAIMAMLLHCPSEPLAFQAFHQVAVILSEMWSDERDERGRRDYHFEGDCEDYLARFARTLPTEQALQAIDPVLSRIDNSPKEVASFVKNLVIAEDNAESPGSFWLLWSEFASRILKARWLSHLEERYPRDEGLLGEMFLELSWNEGVTHWHCLEGQSQLIEDFFTSLPPVAVVFLGFLKFLHDIGERSLPNAFLLLERQLRVGIASKVLSDSNIVFYLETILKRYVYGKPDSLKRDNALRNAVLYLLDQLVDAGSSTAYRMRDDFVTPRPMPYPKIST